MNTIIISQRFATKEVFLHKVFFGRNSNHQERRASLDMQLVMPRESKHLSMRVRLRQEK